MTNTLYGLVFHVGESLDNLSPGKCLICFFLQAPAAKDSVTGSDLTFLNSVESFAWLVVILIVAQLVWFAARQMLAQSAASLLPGLSVQQGLI